MKTTIAYCISDLFKQYTEPCQTVRISTQGKRAVLFLQYFAYKDQSDPLPVRFGGEKGLNNFFSVSLSIPLPVSAISRQTGLREVRI